TKSVIVLLMTAGTASITSIDNTMTNTIQLFTVTSGPACSPTRRSSDLTVTAGTAGSVTVTAKDGNGNVATGYTGTVRFTSSDAQAVLPANYTFVAADNGAHTFTNGVTLKTAGTQSITATDTVTGAITGSQSGITVSAGGAGTLMVAGYPATPTAGTVGTVTVTAKDANGNTATGYTGTVKFTSTDAQAVLPANYTFVAGDNGVHTFTNAVTLKTAGTQSI